MITRMHPIAILQEPAQWGWLVIIVALALLIGSLFVPSVRRRFRGRLDPIPLTLVLLVTLLLAGLALIWLPPRLVKSQPELDPKALLDAQNSVRTIGIAALVALGGAVTAVYTVRTFGLGRQTQLSDRYTKAVDQMTEEKKCLAGIYALEQLMRDSPRDQPAIVEVLASFIRDSEESTEPIPSNPNPNRRRLTRTVHAALTVLARRTPVREEHWIDLRHSDLRGAELGSAGPRPQLPQPAQLQRVNLAGADLQHANLEGADLGGGDLFSANLQHAYLKEANLHGAHLEGANLAETELKDANLRKANLTNANLLDATFEGADLTEAKLHKAKLLEGALTAGQLAKVASGSAIDWHQRGPDGQPKPVAGSGPGPNEAQEDELNS